MAHLDSHRGHGRASILLWCMVGPLVLLRLALVRADGKLFTTESKNGSQGLDLTGAQRSCEALGSRLATADELRRAVRDCSFTVCTRGWLAETTIGTTVCNTKGIGQHVMKAVDVSIESASSASERYDAFCIQNEGKLCGDPPSFPHTILHGHNEFEMGDELLYVCAQGYIMGNREAAFTLLCNTCGEWYGHVQACVKDDTLAHIDYEDNFPDDRTMSVTEPEDEDGEEDVEEEEFPFDGDTAVKTGQEDAHGIFDSIETESRASTESPVSRLSQEHLFWFPSDALTQPQGERELDGGIKTHFADGTNHIGVKTDFSEPGTKMVFDTEDFPLESFLENNDTKSIKDPVASTDESWLDGYPVTEDAAEDGEKNDGSIEVDEDIVLATDEPNYVDIKKTGVTTPVPERDTSQIEAAPTKLLDYGIKGAQVPLTPVSAPENVSTSKGVDDIVGYRPTTQTDFSFEESVTTTVLYDVLEGLPTSILETLATVRPIDHILAPTEADETTTYLNPEDTNGSSAGDTGAFTDASSSEEVLRRATLANELEGGLISTSQPCSKENCPDSSQGPLIAVIVTVLCLLILAILLAMWCYKKRQQKSSVYKMNGKGQTRHPQQIEMQDV